MSDSEEDKVIATIAQHLSLIVNYMEMADTRQRSVPTISRSNTNIMGDWDTRK